MNQLLDQFQLNLTLSIFFINGREQEFILLYTNQLKEWFIKINRMIFYTSLHFHFIHSIHFFFPLLTLTRSLDPLIDWFFTAYKTLYWRTSNPYQKNKKPQQHKPKKSKNQKSSQTKKKRNN